MIPEPHQLPAAEAAPEPTVSATSPETEAQSKIENQNSKIFSGRRGNGKIARLPEAIREQVNNWILDGVSYPEIIKRLGDEGKHLNPDNIQDFADAFLFRRSGKPTIGPTAMVKLRNHPFPGSLPAVKEDRTEHQAFDPPPVSTLFVAIFRNVPPVPTPVNTGRNPL